MTIERATALAQQAAELLPEPPAAHDSFGYLAWEELVLATARRLAGVAAPSGASGTLGAVRLDTRTRRLSGPGLLALAASIAGTADTRPGEAALARAVERCRLVAGRGHASRSRALTAHGQRPIR